MTFFRGQECVFQQDSDPAHKAKTTHEWLRKNFLVFISPENWYSGSANLKTLDNKLWAILEDMACQKHYDSLDSLRRSLSKVSGRDSSEDGVCGDSRVAGASQGLRRGIGRPF
jgi:hypothetical protein